MKEILGTQKRLFPHRNSLFCLYTELFERVNFEGRKGEGAKRKLYENWKLSFDPFWGCFEGVFEGFDLEKRGFEFFEMCNRMQLGDEEGIRVILGRIVVRKFPVRVFVKILTALKRFWERGVREGYSPAQAAKISAKPFQAEI